MDFVLTLHSHLPYVLNHGRWPHGSDWLCEAAVDTYLPLLEVLDALEVENIPGPLTIGVTPILANQLAHPGFGRELSAFFTQRLEACDEAVAVFEANGEDHLIPLAGYWRERHHRLRRLYQRCNGDLIGELRRHAAAGRIELLSSGATHGFLPLLAREESIALQLAVGRAEHLRLFGREPKGCWVPECAYRPRGDWHPDPSAPFQADRPGLEEHLAANRFEFFFVDAHLAEAGRPLGLYRETGRPDGIPLTDDDAAGALLGIRSPHRTYEVAPRAGRKPVVAFVRDPLSTRQVWSRHGGFPGDGAYLEFHKIRFPGGLKFWRVTSSAADLGDKEPYEPNTARARAWGHAAHLHYELRRNARADHAPGESVVVAPFDTELFGHWWYEGVDFIADLYRRFDGGSDELRPRTASQHLAAHPPSAGVALGAGSWGANGDFSMWLNPGTLWTWQRLWPLEERFWSVAADALTRPEYFPVLAQAARELLLLQSSDWQFIISTGAAADYATTRFEGHAADLTTLLDALAAGSEADLAAALDTAEEMRRRDDIFPEILPVLAQVLERREAVSTTR
jgi:1,4-alpha-glucan branching enzyme